MNQDEQRTGPLNTHLRALNKRFTNPLLRRFANASRGPFAILRHVGRRSGQSYETTIMVWPLGDDFVIALTYGDTVDWYRNVLAAGCCTLRWHGREYTLSKPEPLDASTAWQAFPAFIKMILRRQGTQQFVLLKSGGASPGAC